MLCSFLFLTLADLATIRNTIYYQLPVFEHRVHVNPNVSFIALSIGRTIIWFHGGALSRWFGFDSFAGFFRFGDHPYRSFLVVVFLALFSVV